MRHNRPHLCKYKFWIEPEFCHILIMRLSCKSINRIDNNLFFRNLNTMAGICSLHCFWNCFFNRKLETNEMQDLVQMMTQTLHMDARDISFEPNGSRCHSTPLPEFKLNRKYRDTLMLHGKSREGQGDYQISGFPLGNNSCCFTFCFVSCNL